MLARTPKTALNQTIPLEPWRIRLRSALGIWERAHPPKKATPRKLNKDRRRHLVNSVARIMRESREQGAPSHFTFEASCRHGLRSGLCLQGWKWADADAAADEVVKAALNQIGARRPTWQQGQPEWTQPGALPVYRDRCKRCRGPIPEGRRMFCCHECKQWHHMERGNAHAAAERLAANEARHAARSARK